MSFLNFPFFIIEKNLPFLYLSAVFHFHFPYENFQFQKTQLGKYFFNKKRSIVSVIGVALEVAFFHLLWYVITMCHYVRESLTINDDDNSISQWKIIPFNGGSIALSLPLL